jgi:hypothetical protein
MRLRFFFGAIIAVATAFASTTPIHAQGLGEYYVPSTPSLNAPIPTSNPRGAGFYTAFEFYYMAQTRSIGNQVIARAGFFDASGLITGTPGTFVGSGTPALTTADIGKTSYAPGWSVTMGWKGEGGVQAYAKYMQLADVSYTAGASLIRRNFQSRPDLSDSFITAPVFNFPSDYAGPSLDTGFDSTLTSAGNTYGIWNAADEMTIRLRQRFATAEIGGKTPLLETEYSRVYGTGGLRFSWFFERFTWRTVDRDANGAAGPSDSANYTNTLSQRLYGPFIGCGHEVYAGNMLALDLGVSAGGLIGLVKERVKYKLGDPVFPTSAKRSTNQFTFVPNINADLNAVCYPIEGVQIRLGYNFMSYFNTERMSNPVAFDFGNLDPRNGTQTIRILHGFNFGVGLFF